MNTKIYCDIADYDQIKKYSKDSLVKGFTTNPSLMRKAGARDYKKYAIKILSITNKPLSLEVLKFTSASSKALLTSLSDSATFISVI